MTKLHDTCKSVFKREKPPWQWTTQKIVPVPKKGDLTLLTNYRGISVMSTGAKVYNKVLLNRIRPMVEPKLRVNQAGFRPGRGTIEMIGALRRLMEGATARQLELVVTFVDFRKAFDSVIRRMMFAILRHYGVPERLLNAIASLYTNSKAAVLVGGKPQIFRYLEWGLAGRCSGTLFVHNSG